jgi:hypothetical protein
MMMKGATIGLLFAVATAPGCTPSSVMGPLQRQADERELILNRSRGSSLSVEVLNVVAPPLTAEEVNNIQRENESCRRAYMWKNALSWTGGVFVAVAAGVTIGGAYATGNNDTTGKLVFGVSAASLAALGGVLGVVGGIIHQSYFTDRGCVVK